MALTKLTSDLNIISALSDEPNDSDGLTAAQLKAKFDEAANIIKTYLNGTLTEELEGTGGAGNIGITEIPGMEGPADVQAALQALYETIIAASQGSVPNGSITAVKLASDAVETAKIKDANVTEAKLAAGAVATAKLASGAVTPAKTSFIGSGATEPIVLKSGVHYFASAGDLPNDAVTGQLAFAKV